MALPKKFSHKKRMEIDQHNLTSIVRHWLIEDIGRGDITTQLTIPEDKTVKACLLVKEDCVICGLPVAKTVFQTVDNKIKFFALAKEGQRIKKDKIIARLSGKARSILSAERVVLNLLTMLSGIATKTCQYVQEIEPYKTKLTDTRKTFPGLRELEKYAVRIGGGVNHRMSLDEMILIKDNHLKVTSGLEKLPSVPPGFKIEVEVQNLEEFRHAIRFKPDVIMLDNMHTAQMKEAVEIRNSMEFKSHHLPTKLEASGGITLENVKEVAACGVDIISVGELTDSVKSIDMSLEIIN